MDRTVASQTTNKIAGVRAMGAMVVVAAHLIAAGAPAWSATQPDRTVKYPQWYTGMNEMDAAVSARRYKDALAIATRLAVAPGIPPQKALDIHGRVVRYAITVKDYTTATAMVDRMLAADEGNRPGLLKTCVFLAVLQDRIAKAQECTTLYAAFNGALNAAR